MQVTAAGFLLFYLILSRYDYDMHVDSLLPGQLCLAILFSSEQCLQVERVCLQHVQMVNKTGTGQNCDNQNGNTATHPKWRQPKQRHFQNGDKPHRFGMSLI